MDKKTKRKGQIEAVRVKSRLCSALLCSGLCSFLHPCSLQSDVNVLSVPPAGSDVAALAQSSYSSDVCLISDPELWHPTGWAHGRGSTLT